MNQIVVLMNQYFFWQILMNQYL